MTNHTPPAVVIYHDSHYGSHHWGIVPVDGELELRILVRINIDHYKDIFGGAVFQEGSIRNLAPYSLRRST